MKRHTFLTVLLSCSLALTAMACGGSEWEPTPSPQYDTITVRVLNGIGTTIGIKASITRPRTSRITTDQMEFEPGDSGAKSLTFSEPFEKAFLVEMEVTVPDGVQRLRVDDSAQRDGTINEDTYALVVCPVIVERRGQQRILRDAVHNVSPGPNEASLVVINCTLRSDFIDFSLDGQKIASASNDELVNDTNIVTAGRYRAYADATSLGEIEMAGGMNTTVIITDNAGRLTATVWTGMPVR